VPQSEAQVAEMYSLMGGWKSKIQVWAGWFLLRPLPWFVDAIFSEVSHGHSSVCVCVPILSYKHTSQIGSGSTLMTSFCLSHLFQGLSSNTAAF
jgi:hypothetical protein